MTDGQPKKRAREAADDRRVRLLVSDLDGTLLDDGRATPGLAVLRRVVAAFGDRVRLVYATGRTAASTLALVEDGILARPDAIAPLVGSEVWLPPFAGPDSGFARRLADGWSRPDVVAVGERFSWALAPQPPEHAGEFKVSYFVRDDTALPALDEALARRGVRARLIYSGGRFLDVLPRRAGKRGATEYLAERFGVAPADVLAAGDSGNDADVLAHPEYCGVAVGNAEPELTAVTGSLPAVHEAGLSFAAGVLEGAAAHRFWGKRDERFAPQGGAAERERGATRSPPRSS